MSAIATGVPFSVNVVAEACSGERRVVAVEIEGGRTVVDLDDLDDRMRNIAMRPSHR